MKIERGLGQLGLSDEDRGELRDRIGKWMGLSGRHAERLLNILITPMEVQHAYSRGQITLVQADRISRLTWPTQLKIAQEIKGGRDPREVVAAYLPMKSPRPPKVSRLHERLMTELKRGLDGLEGHEDEINHPVFGASEDLELLERLARFSAQMTTFLTEYPEKMKRMREEILTLYGVEVPSDGSDEDAA
jgi:hypothetical protein